MPLSVNGAESIFRTMFYVCLRFFTLASVFFFFKNMKVFGRPDSIQNYPQVRGGWYPVFLVNF